MDKLRQDLENIFGQRVLTDEPLHTYSPDIPTNAQLFITVSTIDELQKVVELSRRNKQKFVFLDRDVEKLNKEFAGLVIKNNLSRFDVLARKGKIQSGKTITEYALIEAESGVPFNQLVRFTIDQELGGIEDGLGLAGAVGAVIEREKAYVESLLEQGIIQSLKVLDVETNISDISAEALKDDLIVLSVIFKLVSEEKRILWLKAKKAAAMRGIEEYTYE